ncbi:VanZ family protein [Nocardiopsis sp. EMB25]|uniref:VanZ family protein n=1 Tax=Nocardiopsis sp. EMB25 TaxID=2835867 RepID=UPI0022843020|nr:VanZ family protein [Nocardiopsis sp. EMB25]MCY9786136.1 VanZ family protein [Nocardiopsis sp. EMB25]
MRTVHGSSVWHAVLHIDAGAAPLLLGTLAIPALPLAWLWLVRPRAARALGVLGIAAVLSAYAVLVVGLGGEWAPADHVHKVSLPSNGIAANVAVTDPNPLRPPTPFTDELLAQAVLFVPLGLVAFPTLTSAWGRVVLGPLVSVTVEGLQFTLASGQGASLTDLCANTVGHLVGLGMMGCASVLLGCRVDRPEHESVPDRGVTTARDR